MIERALFILSDDITDETVLAVLSALQAFETNVILKNTSWNKLHKQNRQVDFKMCLAVTIDRYNQLYKKCLNNLHSIDSLTNLGRAFSWTYITEISIERAIDIGKASKRPLAESIGVLIGAEAGSLPDVSNLCTEYSLDTLYLLDADVQEDTAIDQNAFVYPFSKVDIGTIEEKITAVFSAKIIVGHSSFETYLGCALRKPVLEIQSQLYLFKWSNPNYQCITKTENFKAYLAKGITQCQSVIDAST